MDVKTGELKISERIFSQRKRLANVVDSLGLVGGETGLTGGYLAWVEKEISAAILGLTEIIDELEKEGK